MTDTISPNTPVGAVAESPAVPSMDSIAAKMTAMKEMTLRNQIGATNQTATGQDEEAEQSSSPVANDMPEIDDTENYNSDGSNQEADAPEQVSTGSNDSTADELIDFVEFADSNPNAKFKFVKNGKEVIMDAKKAAAILGQGGAIHEEARQLKIERAEFDEYLQEAQARQEGLTLAMEFTVQPKLQQAYDEILKTQNFNITFQQQLTQTRDPALIARIQASMAQNERWIQQQQQTISQLKPAIDQFRQVRSQQVSQRLEQARKGFTDKELKNEYVYNEVREKVSKLWRNARDEIIPGVPNIDLISSDEALLSLVRDGLRYRDKPTTKSAGSSMAALTNRKGSSAGKDNSDDIGKLREQANRGDKKASDNLLMAQLNRIKASRGGR
jgi:hypothetical protein